MARDASGTYTRVSNTFSSPVAGTAISPTDAEALFDDVETEITDSLSRSGKGGMSATAVLKIADGTSAAPALTFNNDTDTGLARTTANTMIAVASGVAVITVTPSGANATINGGTITGITDLALADGGTGASSAVSARGTLGLGTIATQAANNVTITGGSITGITDLAVADGGTGASDTTTARSNLGAASRNQTEGFFGFIKTVADQDYRIVLKVPYAGTITETTTRSASGTATATFKVNTTALGGTANSVSTSEASQAHASNNTFAADDDLVITMTSASACIDMSFTIEYTRIFD